MGSLPCAYQLFCLQLLLFYSYTLATLCSHEQSSALLQFKQLFSFDNRSSLYCDEGNNPSYPKMMSWKEGNDCCSWDGVQCDMVTGQVIGLDLSCSWLHGTMPSNTSLFLIRNLQTLNLAFNDFNLSQISSDFSRFSGLTHLNLSYSNFSGQIPSEISHLSKLVSLDLSSYYNYSDESFEMRVETPVLEGLVRNLTNLTELFLDNMDMSTIAPSSLANLSSSLTSLSLRHCGMKGNFPDHIFKLPNLQVLDLGWNFNLRGNFPKHNWSSALEHLDVSNMNFSGALPNSISNIKSLRYLSLSNCKLFGSIPPSLGNLTQLTYLVLSFNGFIGSIPNTFVHLKKLSNLDLYGNQLLGPIPPILGNLTQLTYLGLSFNGFIGSIPNTFVNLKKLSNLDLYRNQLLGPIPPSLGNLTQLTQLDLSYNSFFGTIPETFVNLQQLSGLYIASNQLIGPIPSLLRELPNLVDIDLYNNSFNGTLPSSLFNLPLLEYIDLSYNQLVGHIEDFQSNTLRNIYLDGNRLHGSIPSSIFELVNLTALDLSSNNLSGSLELSIFAKLKNLETLGLSYNSLSVSTTSKANSSFPQLRLLFLSACNISEFPDILRSLSKSLEYLDLSNNKIQGQIPSWIYDIGKDSLRSLNLSHNFLTGIKKLPWKTLETLDLHSNFIQGSIPNPPPYLRYFLMSNNKLTRVVPYLICNLSVIEILDFSNNSLTGNIPKCIGNFSNNLRVLDLRKNRFYGTIPETFAKGSSLKTLNFNSNGLDGQLPRSLVNCTMLEVLDVGNNKINGTFPYWLGNLSKLQVFVLRSNKFYGSIWNFSQTSNSSFPMLRILDVSNNSFNGSLPIRYFQNMKAMMNIDEVERKLQYMGENYYHDSVTVVLKGFYIELERIITIFTSIDLSNNNFHGEIPEIIGELHALRLLNLSHNNLIGCILSSLGNLDNLESLDLSSNKLVGKIPLQLTRLHFLQIINLSNNQLEGPIPRDNHFETFPNTSYIGNERLCGFPLSNKCGSNDTQQSPSILEDDAKSTDVFGWKIVLIGFGCGVAFGMIMGFIIFSRGKPQWIVEIVAYLIAKMVESECPRKGRRPLEKREGRLD